jgi:hypothetical protein
MKKRLLITSIVMMLVVAVALSTATYAWFTSNATVSASTITMTAAVNELDSIFIKWNGGSYGGSITTTKTYGGDVLIPMVPDEIVVNQTTLFETGVAGAHDIDFKTAGLETVAGDSVFKNVTAVSNANYVYFANATNAQNPEDPTSGANVIFIKNTSTANVVTNVKVKATFTPNYIACNEGELARAGYTYYTYDSSAEVGSQYTEIDDVVNNVTDVTGKYKATVELVRVAVFTRDLTAAGTNDTESAYILRGVLANTADAATYFGDITNGASQSAFNGSTSPFTDNTLEATAGATGFNICYDGNSVHTLAAQGEVEIKVLMWLDGEALNDNTQGAIANVALQFEAV